MSLVGATRQPLYAARLFSARLPQVAPRALAHNMADVKEEVQRTIAAHNVVVFSKTYCPYCVKVKGLFDKIGVSFHAVELDTVAKGSQMQDALKQLTGQSTVPNVFIKGKHVGGCDDTHRKHQSGELATLLA